MTVYRPLTIRQSQIGLLLVQGLTVKQVAVELGLSRFTVRNHIQDAGNRLSALSHPDIPPQRRLVRFVRSRQQTVRGAL